MGLNQYIDHTLLKADAKEDHIITLCSEALEYEFAAVCVNGSYVSLAKKHLMGSNVKLATVVGFPLGAMSTAAKVCEAKSYINEGADEIDMVIDIGWLRSGELEFVENDIRSVKDAIDDKVLKVIIETCYLNQDEKIIACKLAASAGADYVKTSTGFGTGGATLGDVKLMKETIGDRLKIKASGGIRDRETALHFIELGASRIGTSSGIKIMNTNK